ncbi:MAG: hypothetical protein P8N76_12545 [Pirellulaceae bacterium]|nr:hypothetical protein [Pirellulaceae bacterium]
MSIFRLLPAALAAFLLIGDFSVAQPPAAQDRDERAGRGERGAGRGERGAGRGERGAGRGERGTREGRSMIIIALDIDSDGEISSEELANAVAVLKKLDKNEDGKLTRDEFAGENRRGGPRGNEFGGRPDGPGRERFQGPGRGGPGASRGAEFIERLMEADTNDDGKLSQDELPERMRERADQIDSDGDGYVTKKELEEMIKARFSGGQSGRPGGADRGNRSRRPQRPEQRD